MAGEGRVGNVFNQEIADNQEGDDEMLDRQAPLVKRERFSEDIEEKKEVQDNADHAELRKTRIVGIGDVAVVVLTDAFDQLNPVFLVNIGVVDSRREGGETGKARAQREIVLENLE